MSKNQALANETPGLQQRSPSSGAHSAVIAFATDRTSKTMPAAEPAPREYEELDGAQGREIYFRPQRHRASELTPLLGQAEAVLRGQRVTGALVDVSQSGVAFAWANPGLVAVGDILNQLTVKFDGFCAYEGAGRVGSVRLMEGQLVMGVSFIRSMLDIDDVLRLREVRTWSAADEVPLDGGTPLWRVPGHAPFRSEIADFRLFLEDAAERLDTLEASLPWSVVHGEQEAVANVALRERLQTEFAPAVLGYFGRIDAAMRAADPAAMLGLKAFSQRQLDAFLLRAPLLHRARTKPLGYPGDFDCMNYMYLRHFEGQTLFAKALHMASCLSLPAQAVRARKDVIKRALNRAVSSPSEKPLRVASIAAGPAQEIFEFLSEAKELHRPLEIVLFDQDKTALAFAQRRLAPLVEARWAGKVRLVLLHDSIKRLLHDHHVFGPFGAFDLVFSTGLFDYLRFPTAVTLTRNLYRNMAFGGTAYIGNMKPENPARWIFEHHLEWTLLYRTPEEMLAFANEAQPDSRATIVEDATSLNPFVVLHKD